MMKKQIQNKEEYLKELENLLKVLPELERQNALKYYEEYFSDAGKENELSVISELGDVNLLADKIIGEESFKEQEEVVEESKKVRNRNDAITLLLLIALLVFGIPVLLPVAASILGVTFALACAGIGICIAGIVCFGVAISLVINNLFAGILAFGISFILLALGIALSIAIVFLGVKVIPFGIRWLVNVCKKILGMEV